MSGLGRVCETCAGRGRVYTARGVERCPECRHWPSRLGERATARNRLAICWAAFQKGDTGDYNLEVAVRLALDAGWTVEALAEKVQIPREKLRRAAEGQGNFHAR